MRSEHLHLEDSERQPARRRKRQTPRYLDHWVATLHDCLAGILTRWSIFDGGRLQPEGPAAEQQRRGWCG